MFAREQGTGTDSIPHSVKDLGCLILLESTHMVAFHADVLRLRKKPKNVYVGGYTHAWPR